VSFISSWECSTMARVLRDAGRAFSACCASGRGSVVGAGPGSSTAGGVWLRDLSNLHAPRDGASCVPRSAPVRYQHTGGQSATAGCTVRNRTHPPEAPISWTQIRGQQRHTVLNRGSGQWVRAASGHHLHLGGSYMHRFPRPARDVVHRWMFRRVLSPWEGGCANWLSLRACDWCELDREPQRARRP